MIERGKEGRGKGWREGGRELPRFGIQGQLVVVVSLEDV